MSTKLIIIIVAVIFIGGGLLMWNKSKKDAAALQLQMAQQQAYQQQPQLGGQYGSLISGIFGLATAGVNAYSANQANKGAPKSGGSPGVSTT